MSDKKNIGKQIEKIVYKEPKRGDKGKGLTMKNSAQTARNSKNSNVQNNHRRQDGGMR